MHIPHYSPLLIAGNIFGLIAIIILAYIIIWRRPKRLLKSIIFSVVIYLIPAHGFWLRNTGYSLYDYAPLMWITIVGSWVSIWAFYLASIGKPTIVNDKISQGFRNFFRS